MSDAIVLSDLRPYAEYKNSAVPWLGEVPEHWVELPLKRIAKIDNSGSYGDELENAEQVLPVATTAQINRDGRFVVEKMPLRGFSRDEVGRYGCNPGDILVVKSSGSIFNVITGKVGLVDKKTPRFVFSNFLMRVVPQSHAVNARFLFFLLSSHLTQERVKRMVSGTTYPNLRMGEYISALLPLPPPLEQSAIVGFLDHAERRISRYIHAKQKLIKLLEEHKQAIIHRAVTRGFDPSAGFKPSGMKWLGGVPEHWDIRPAKRHYREIDERSESGVEELLPVSHLTGVTARSQKKITMFMADTYARHKRCQAGDLVINTMWAWMGALGVAWASGLVSPSYGVYRPLAYSELVTAFADLLFRTQPYVAEYNCRSTGIHSSRLRLYPDQFLRIPVICPPRTEQHAILEHVASATKELNEAQRIASREIALLREYRTRLIADVVTGKLDVREATVRLKPEPNPLHKSDALSNAEEEPVDQPQV